MKTILSTLSLFLSLCLFNSLIAQEEKPKREIGIDFTSINGLLNSSNYGFLLLKQREDQSYNRFRIGFSDFRLSQQSNEGMDENLFSFNLDFAFGREQRRSMAKKLLFVNGIEYGISFRHTHNKWERSDPPYLREFNENAISVAVGYLIGVQYDFQPHLYIRGTLSPFLHANFKRDTTLEEHDPNDDRQVKNFVVGGGIGNRFGIILGYRFGK